MRILSPRLHRRNLTDSAGPPGDVSLPTNRGRTYPLFAVCGVLVVPLLVLHLPDDASAQASGEIPPQAAAVGYKTNTFRATFSKSAIDMDNTGKSGFQWYPWRFFGQPTTPPETIKIGGDGILTLGTDTLGSSIATGAPTKTASHWVGTAFGGGAYFEAALRFDPDRTAKGKSASWPAFWSMAVEHTAGLSSQHWPGQPPGYMHFAELDFFEYDLRSFSPQNYYGGALHEWWGIYKTTCPGTGFCGASNAGRGGSNFSNFKVKTPSETDFKSFHRFGVLWVPASPANKGYAQYYFDGAATDDKVSWDQYASQPPSPGAAPWTFGILDKQHLIIVLSTGIGQPMTVGSVLVWQGSTAQNLSQ